MRWGKEWLYRVIREKGSNKRALFTGLSFEIWWRYGID